MEAVFRSASGEHAAAAAALGELARLHPTGATYQRGLARELLASGRMSNCVRATARAKPSADAQLALTEAYCRAGASDYPGALNAARRAGAAARQVGQREIYARARLVEAGLLMSTSHGADAIAPRDEARRICAEIGDDSCVIGALRIEANAEIGEMRPGVALAAYRAALPLARKMGSVKETTELLDGEGYALMLMGDFAGSDAAFVDALLAARRAGQGTAGLRQDMVELALSQGQLDRAIILAKQAAQDAAAGGDRVTEAYAQIFEARALFLRGDLAGCAAILERVHRAIAAFHLSAGSAVMADRARQPESRSRQIGSGRQGSGGAHGFRRYFQGFRLSGGAPAAIHQPGTIRRSRERGAGHPVVRSGGGNQSASVLVTALLSDAYGYSRRLQAARETAKSARAMLSEHIAPASRSMALAAAARWAQPALEASSMRSW